MDELREVAKKHNALIIEDAAESLGATYKGIQTGNFGEYNCISFNGNKIITGSSGGMFLTNSLEDAHKVRKWSTQATEKNFLSLFNAINAIAEKYDMPILYSCHPRSRKRLEQSGFKLDPRVIQHEPLGFHDYNCLQMNAFAVISDSGT